MRQSNKEDDRGSTARGPSRREALAAGAVTAGLVLAGCGTTGAASPRLGAAAGLDAAEAVRQWPAKPREVAEQMIGKYGPPEGVTPSRLIWAKSGPWKETIVYRNEIPHDFPMSHTDLLEQSVDYRVPPDKADELLAYDGSVIIERTKGTMAARCDVEEMNFLALNLAHDIVTGKRTVEDARRFYTETAMAFKMGQKPPYTERLQFTPQGKSADPDRETV